MYYENKLLNALKLAKIPGYLSFEADDQVDSQIELGIHEHEAKPSGIGFSSQISEYMAPYVYSVSHWDGKVLTDYGHFMEPSEVIAKYLEIKDTHGKSK